MDMRKFAGGGFIGIDDVRDGPIQATIIKVVEGNYEKPDLILDDGRRFALNVTNTRVLLKAFGPNAVDWIAMGIELYLGELKYQGKMQDAVLVRALSPGKPVAERTAPPELTEVSDEMPPYE